MIRLKLAGAARARFGKEFKLASANTPAQAIHALVVRLPGFRKYLEDHSEPGFHVLVGKQDIGEDELGNPAVGKVVTLVPAVVASSNGIRIIGGVALIALSYVPFLAPIAPFLFNAGVGLVLGGVAGMLTKAPAFNPSALDKGPADTPSYAFAGPHMTTGQGNCVPLGYGRCRVGGALISAGICPETWTKNGLGGQAPDEVGTRGGDGDTSAWIWAVAPVAG